MRTHFIRHRTAKYNPVTRREVDLGIQRERARERLILALIEEDHRTAAEAREEIAALDKQIAPMVRVRIGAEVERILNEQDQQR